MRSVRISLKTAKRLLDILSEQGAYWAGSSVVDELRAAMAPKKFVKASRKERTKKRAAHNEETSDIRAEVFKRAGNLCELCLRASATDLQHCLGRIKRPQAVHNTLALCRPCHVIATEKTPATLIFQAACLEARGHREAPRDLRDLAAWLKAKADARKRLKGARSASMTRGAGQ